MKLYIVYNGFTGDGAVHRIVIASNEQEAKELASSKFKKEADGNYPKSYWTELNAELLSTDTSISYVSEVIG